MIAADPRRAQLSELSACAYRLGLAFGHEAERAEEAGRKLEYFQLFDRCFFAVRVATALELRLRRTPETVRDDGLADRAEPPEREPERERGEGAEREADAAAPRERDRDEDREREAEPASLPVLLRTLDAVAADAASLPGPAPADLPTLRELLTHAARAPAPKSRPVRPSGPGLRAKLSGSATALALHPEAGAAGRRPLGISGLAPRRATGPPRR